MPDLQKWLNQNYPENEKKIAIEVVRIEQESVTYGFKEVHVGQFQVQLRLWPAENQEDAEAYATIIATAVRKVFELEVPAGSERPDLWGKPK